MFSRVDFAAYQNNNNKARKITEKITTTSFEGLIIISIRANIAIIIRRQIAELKFEKKLEIESSESAEKIKKLQDLISSSDIE